MVVFFVEFFVAFPYTHTVAVMKTIHKWNVCTHTYAHKHIHTKTIYKYGLIQISVLT